MTVQTPRPPLVQCLEIEGKKVDLGWAPSPQCKCSDGSRMVLRDKKSERLLRILSFLYFFAIDSCIFTSRFKRGFRKHGNRAVHRVTRRGQRSSKGRPDFIMTPEGQLSQIHKAKHFFCIHWFQLYFSAEPPGGYSAPTQGCQQQQHPLWLYLKGKAT